MNGRFELRWFAVFVFAVLAGCGENGQTVKDVDDATPGGGGDPTVPPPAQGSPGRLSLGATSITVGEGESVEIDVIRSGGTTGAVTVLVATHDGTAVAPADYSSVQTTVSFAAGDSAPKRVTVAVVDDSDDEPGETFSIVLSSPTGGATLGAAQEALITIQDNDVAAPTSPRAALSARYRRLRIDWTGVQDATTYRVLRKRGRARSCRSAAIFLRTRASSNSNRCPTRNDGRNSRIGSKPAIRRVAPDRRRCPRPA
jgi:hypothetical protein